MTTPSNPSPLLSCRPNPSLPLHRRPRFPHSPAAANTTGAASSPEWFRPRRTPDTEPSTSSVGRVTARDPGVRVKAKEGAEEEKDKKGKRRRWWERWSGDRESYLVDDVEPLPIPLTVPETEPMSREELDRRLNCDVDIDVSVSVFFLGGLGLAGVMILGCVNLGCSIAKRFLTSGRASAGAARGRGSSATSGRRARRPSASVCHAPALVR